MMRIDFMDITTGEVYASSPRVAVENGAPAHVPFHIGFGEHRRLEFDNGLTLSILSLEFNDGMLEIAVLRDRVFVGKDLFPEHFSWDNVLRLGSGEDSVETWIERVRAWTPA